MEKVVSRVAMVCAALMLVGCGSRSAQSGAGGCPPPAASNQLPFGVLDAPADKASVARELTASGWAMDDVGVAAVRLYVDSHFVQSTELTVDRPDVSAAVPAFSRQSDRHGWTTQLTLEPGAHTLLAQAVDGAGATRDLGSITVTVAR